MIVILDLILVSKLFYFLIFIFLLISASRIRYEITRGNFGGAFAVKNMTGAIYVAGPLDYEQRKRVNIISAFIKKKTSEWPPKVEIRILLWK